MHLQDSGIDSGPKVQKLVTTPRNSTGLSLTKGQNSTGLQDRVGVS